MLNPQTNKLNEFQFPKKFVQPFFLAIGLTLLITGLDPNNTFALPSEPDVVDEVTIQYSGNGFAASYTLPIYQVGDIRFISAGVGLDERRASYPPFPLKLIFAQASGAYLSGVSVTIQDSAGKEILKIAESQTTGPWLFLDLQPGTYQVTAVRGDGTQVKKTIHLPEGKTRGVHLHWPESTRNG